MELEQDRFFIHDIYVFYRIVGGIFAGICIYIACGIVFWSGCRRSAPLTFNKLNLLTHIKQ